MRQFHSGRPLHHAWPASSKSHRVRRAFGAAGLALAMGAAGASAAEAAPAQLVAPSAKAPVSGKITFKVKNVKRVAAVGFYVDGRRVDRDTKRPFRVGRSGVLDTAKLDDGRHRLSVKVRTKGGKLLKRSRVITVRNVAAPVEGPAAANAAAKPPAAAPAPAPAPVPGGPVAEVLLGSGPTYYVDSAAGNDAAAGTSPATAWRSASKASAVTLPAGANILFKRGGSWSQTLLITESGIFVGAYGSGNRPAFTAGTSGYSTGCVDVQGHDNTIQDLAIDRCAGRNGIRVSGDRNLVVRTAVSHNQAGVQIPGGADANRFLGNELIANNVMTKNTPGGDDDYGAYSFANEGGTNTEIAYNTIRDARAPSADYGEDGSCLEIFRGSVNFHHNTCDNAPAGVEMSGVGNGGGATRIAYNVFGGSITSTLILQPGSKFAGDNAVVTAEYNTLASKAGWNGDSAGKLVVRRTILAGSPFVGATSGGENVTMSRSQLDSAFKPLSGSAAWTAGSIAYGAHANGGL